MGFSLLDFHDLCTQTFLIRRIYLLKLGVPQQKNTGYSGHFYFTGRGSSFYPVKYPIRRKDKDNLGDEEFCNKDNTLGSDRNLYFSVFPFQYFDSNPKIATVIP